MLIRKRVISIPRSGLLQSEGVSSFETVRGVFRSILQAATPSTALPAIELVLCSDSAGTIGLEVLFYNGSAAEARAALLQMEKIGFGFADTGNDPLMPAPQDALFIVKKAEKAVGSTLSATGYYYYSDLFEAAGETLQNSFGHLPALLQQYPGTQIRYQLIPVALMPQETYAINEMAGALAQTVQGVSVYGQFVRETYAEPVLRMYRDYAERLDQPFFLYNLVVCGSPEAASVIAQQLRSHIQAGLRSPAGLVVRRVAEAAQLAQTGEEFPFRLNLLLQQRYLEQSLWNTMMIKPVNLARVSFMVTAEEASCFFRLPVDNGDFPDMGSTQLLPGETLVSGQVRDEDNVRFGMIRGKRIPIGVPADALTQHMLIVGMPGTGKTTFSIHLLLQLHRKGIPFLAIEPTKTEYRAMIDAIPDLRVFTPGNDEVSPFIVNPFLPPKGVTVDQYVPSLAAAFKAAFSMPQPLDMVFLRAIRNCYAEYGWKGYSTVDDPDVRYFGLFEFILGFKRLIGSLGYGNEVRSNIESAGTLRLMNLLEQSRSIYDTVHTIPLEDLIRHPTVLELNAIDNTEYKALIIALLLINVCTYIKHVRESGSRLRNVLLIDEAHVLLDDQAASGNSESADAQGTTKKAIQDMIAEVRAYGTGIIIADQSPGKVGREIVANTDVKIAFRLVDAREAGIIADSTAMEENERKYLARLSVGEAFVYNRLLNAPRLIVTPDIRKDEHIRLSVSNDEVCTRSTYWTGHEELLCPYAECRLSDVCGKACDRRTRAEAEYYAEVLALRHKAQVNDPETLGVYVSRIRGFILRQKQGTDRIMTDDLRRLCNCTAIAFMRKILLEKNINLDPGKREMLIGRCLEWRQ